MAVFLTLLVGVIIGANLRGRWWWHRVDRRLGLFPTVGAPTAEAERAERLRQLGETGTLRVYNCGTILHVDYARGQLVVEREGRQIG